MSWKDWSIARRIVLISVVPLVVMFLALLLSTYLSRVREVKGDLQERGQLVASLLADSSEYGLVSGDLAYLKPTIQSLLQLDGSIVSVEILDAEKRSVFRLDKPDPVDSNSRVFEEPIKRSLVAANPFGGRDAPHVANQASSAEVIKSQEAIGYVRVVASAADMLAKQRQRLLVAAGIGLVTLAFAVALALMLSMNLTNPLRRTMAAVRAIRAGNHPTDVSVSTGGEIGELQSSIHDMARRLNEFARGLESKVAERTQELAAARDEALKLSAERVKLIQKVTTALEEERRLIATELHDHLNAQLIVMGLTAQRIGRLANDPSSSLTAKHEVSEAAQSIVSSIAELYAMSRQLVRTLRPEILDTLGLSGAIEEMVRYYDALHKDCEFRFQEEGESVELDDETSIAAYRLVQEALSNVVKHSAAKVVTVKLLSAARGIRIEVQDDGKGFDPLLTEPGIGLIGMRERVQGLGGRFELHSQPAKGTTIVIALPAPKPQSE